VEIGIDKVFSLENVLIIDMRTKEEYMKSHIINAINFEILTYEERKKVSILYNNKKKEEAYLIAYEYSLEKLAKLFEIIRRNKKKKIVFYCSRGGSRSSIVYDVFKNLKGIEIYKIDGGYKSYRKFINNYFENELKKFDFRIIRGLRGSGIDELLNKLNTLGIDTINLNDEIYNEITQKQFDNILFNKLFFMKNNIIYIKNENEIFFNISTRKKFINHFDSNINIVLKTNMEFRINNIYEKFFLECDECFINDVIKKVESLRKEISNKIADEIINDILTKNYIVAIEKLLIHYYDKTDIKELMKYEPYSRVIEFNNIEELFRKWSE
jgi:tRNA 2-selenouridine synthase